jgi:hypothetical protein
MTIAGARAEKRPGEEWGGDGTRRRTTYNSERGATPGGICRAPPSEHLVTDRPVQLTKLSVGWTHKILGESGVAASPRPPCPWLPPGGEPVLLLLVPLGRQGGGYPCCGVGSR